jgi:hypothetical protein
VDERVDCFNICERSLDFTFDGSHATHRITGSRLWAGS